MRACVINHKCIYNSIGWHDRSRESGFQEGRNKSSSWRGDDLDLQLLNPNPNPNPNQKNNMCGESISSVSSPHNTNIDDQYQHHYESLLRSLLEPDHQILLMEPYYTQPLPRQQPLLHQFSTDINTSSANRPATTTPIDVRDLRLSSAPRNSALVSHALKEINLNRSNRAAKVSVRGTVYLINYVRTYWSIIN